MTSPDIREKAAELIWNYFSVRHGGPFDPNSDTRAMHDTWLLTDQLIALLPSADLSQSDGAFRQKVQRLQNWLDDFDRENADDIDAEDFNVGQDELIEVPAEDLRAVLAALSTTEGVSAVLVGGLGEDQ